MPPGPDLVQQGLAALRATPVALALDNAETPWETDPAGTEAALAALAAVPGVALLVTMRGQQRPPGAPWREAVGVLPLGYDDARRVFVALAGQRFADDPLLPALVAAQDGVPLALELLAYQAEAEPDLAGLWRRWQRQRVELLQRGRADTAHLNAAVSFELSVGGPRMTQQARRLLSLLALLPDGVAHDDLDALLPTSASGEEAAATLRKVGLAFDLPQARRLRVLRPIRDHVSRHHQPDPADLAHTIAHYTILARTLGPTVGREGGQAASLRLAAEPANLDAMVHTGLHADDPRPAINAAIGLVDFVRFSGLGAPDALQAALPEADRLADPGLRARILQGLGDIALDRSDHAGARQRYEQALPLFEQVGDVLGQANCIRSLGDIALDRSDHAGARQRYEQALPLFEQVGSVLGQANCIRSLGDIALDRSDHAGARQRYEQALPLFEQALGLYQRIEEPYSIGMAHRRLARLAADPSERDRHVASARSAWESIDRSDLVTALDEEFGGEANAAS